MDPPRCDGITDNVISPRLHGRGDLFREEEMETELDIDETINKTCNRGGLLQIEMMRPRKNAVKLLLLMDSGGTMIPFMKLMNELFQAIHKSNHYKDVKTYYFHNCIYAKMYRTPECEN